MLAQVRIVLVSPSGPANVGAVARGMANLGLADLVIVAPRCDLQAGAAEEFARRGKPVLAAARVVPDLDAALAGCVRTFATTSKPGLYRQGAVAPAAAAEEAMAAAAAGRVAFAFGREDHGLKTRELLDFDRIVTIPTDQAYPVLNLAAAVTIMCYELRRAWLAGTGQSGPPGAMRSGWATQERKTRMFEQLFVALERIGFFFGPNPDHLKHALRRLFGRVELSVNEADILTGLARQIQWYVRHNPRRIDSGD